MVAFWCGCLQLWFCFAGMLKWPICLLLGSPPRVSLGGTKRWQQLHAMPIERGGSGCHAHAGHRLPCARPHLMGDKD